MRPLSLTDLGQRPRDLLMSDFLYVNPHGQLLTIVDSLSRKLYLKFAKVPNVQTVVQGMLEFRANFNLADNFVLTTDNGSYYASHLFAELKQRLRCTHNILLPTAPGQMEVLRLSTLPFSST